MRYEIILSPESVADLRRLSARIRATVEDALEVHLRHEPAKTSKSRIKRLRELAQPQYRLRVGDIRVFYDVVEERVEVLAVIAKGDVVAWLASRGPKT